ncbi:MAG: DUF5682 family protein [Vulcanimicrobiota bacterium]
MKWPRVVGVRHHSPACARLVASLIRREKPRFVLIEGPSDFNPRMAELQLEHQLPVALFSSCQGERRVYTPFCDYSPEWVALRVAAQVGAEPLFMDLPAWHSAFCETPNRYHDRFDLDQEKMARQVGYDCSDGLWDAWVEQAEEDRLEQQLHRYFEELRQTVSAQDQEREAFMAQCLAWAQAQGPTLAVCGGFHAPYLEQAWRDFSPEWPQAERLGETCLVPFSFARLDSFTGYSAGMPSPAYYQAVWEGGWQQAARHCLAEVASYLRARQQSLSSADLIAAHSSAVMLQRMRGHRHLSRIDLLDGLAASLIKEALDGPLPWSYRGRLKTSSHPVLSALLEVFSGSRRGKLDPRTPRPALAVEVLSLLEQYDLKPTHPPRSRVVLPGSVESHILHRLRLLNVHGFTLLAEQPESWSLAETLEFEPSLLEASAFGGSLEEAACQALEARIEPESGASEVGACLAQASRAGLLELSFRWLARLQPALQAESQVGPLAAALASLDISLRVAPSLEESGRRLIYSGLERMFWLLEGLETDPPDLLEAMVISLDLLRRYPNDWARTVAERLAAVAPLTLRGSALGMLWSLFGEAEPAPPSLVAAVRGVYPPEMLGDFLHGLFALARQSVLEQDELLRELHELLTSLEPEVFLRALPPLRQAFERFPPAEKQEIALRLMPWLGLKHPRQVLRSSLSPEQSLQAAELDLRVERECRSLGW